MYKQTIVIDREYGSGGREVAKILAQKLGIDFYDGNLLIMTGERYGINLGVLRDYDEKGVGSFLYDMALFSGSVSGDSHIDKPFQAFEAQGRLMKELVKQKPCIFLGRCAASILQDYTPLLRVFIFADNMNDRIQRAVTVDGIPEGNASAYIRKKDKQRQNYYKFFTDQTWGDPSNYDLLLNTSSLGYDKAADAILAALKGP